MGLRALLVGMQNGPSAVGDSLAVSQKAKQFLQRGLNNSTPKHIYRRTDSRDFNNACRPRLIRALFTIIHHGQRWKQPKGPSTDEWRNTMWHTPAMQYSSAIRRNEVVAYAPT